MEITKEVTEQLAWKLPSLNVEVKMKDGQLVFIQAFDSKFNTSVKLAKLDEVRDLHKALSELIHHIDSGRSTTHG